MTKRVQIVRHTSTALSDAFTGLEGELSIDLEKDELRIHDGALAGGYSFLRSDWSNLPADPNMSGSKIANFESTGIHDTASATQLIVGDSTFTYAGNEVLDTTDIGVSVQAYDANLPAGSTILVDGDIGTAVQAFDSDLSALAAITIAADEIPYGTGAATWSKTGLTAFARTILDDVDAATVRTTIGAQIAGSYQASDTFLTSIAALGTAADRYIYTTGADVAAEGTITAFGRSILDDADAAAVRTTIDAAQNIAASESAAGLIEIATQSEVDTGTDDARAVTPLKLTSALSTASKFPRGHINRLNTSTNATDALHDIDIATGECRDKDDTENIVLTTALGKQIDAAWTVGGTPGATVGGLDTGTVAADQTYHLHLIKRTDTGVVDALFSLSLDSPTLPADYDKSRRIRSVLTDSSANIIPCEQRGDRFNLDVPVRDFNASNPGTSAVLRALTVPSGLKVDAIVTGTYLDSSGSSTVYILFTDPDITDTAASSSAFSFAAPDTGSLSRGGSGPAIYTTNTSAQIRTRLSFSTGTTTLTGVTHGWYDRRGKDD